MTFLNYNNVRLLDTRFTAQVADEVIINDVYKISTIPKQSTVIDVGAFYGEFSIMCALAGFKVVAFEPVKESFRIANINIKENQVESNVSIFNLAISDRARCSMNVLPHHPAGSTVIDGNEVDCTTLSEATINLERIAVKLDCEGAEEVIFKEDGWMKKAVWVSMEVHNANPKYYADMLKQCGFSNVEFECSILHAIR